MRLPTIVLGIVLVPALVCGQSLGDAAAKERERRRKLKESGKSATVIDGDALRTSKGSLANEPRAAASPAPAPAKAGAKPVPAPTPRPASVVPELPKEDAPPQPDNGEAAWRQRAADARAQIELWQKRYEYWSELHLAPGDYFVDDDGQKLVGSAESLQQIIGRAKAQLDAAKQALVDLEEQARRQNVPPGWLR